MNTTPAQHIWTEREISDALPNGFATPAGPAGAVRAVCLPSDEGGASPAQFDIRVDWGDGIPSPHDDISAHVDALVRRVEEKFPSPDGWNYDPANGTIDQIASYSMPGWAPVAGL